MSDIYSWDWDNGKKLVADISEWEKKYIDIRELTPSEDGEAIAAIVQPEKRKFTIQVNNDFWGELFERMYSLKFNLENLPICLAYKDYEWSVVVGKETWEEKFDMAWNLTLSPDTKSIALNIRTGEMTSGVCLNGVTWGNTFPEARDLIMSPDGKRTASHVQIRPRKELDIEWLYQKNYTVAIDGQAWDNSFLVIWGCTFSDDGSHVAAVAMTDMSQYSIVVDGVLWNKVYGACWEPIFKPGTYDVIAPVQTPNGWTLASNGNPIWGFFTQVWRQRFSVGGDKLAAVVATGIGNWTVAVDGKPWRNVFNQMVLTPVFSPDGRKVAVTVKHNNKYTVVVDNVPWSESFDLVWDPIFSPTSDKVAVRAEKNGKYFVVVDGRISKKGYEWLWDPKFSPDGSKILIRYIDDGKYYREVSYVADV
jgi:hypothetical protein